MYRQYLDDWLIEVIIIVINNVISLLAFDNNLLKGRWSLLRKRGSVMSMAKLPVAELRIGNYVVCVKNRLAEGGFGYVDRVYDANSKVEYVLKRAGIERNEVYEVVKKEISILQRYAGPHLVKLLASEVIVLSKGKREACLLLELCPGGHLLDRISGREGKHLPPPSLYRIFGQLLLAIQPMHESNPPVTHRDLKLENILFGAVYQQSYLWI
jgi:Protein kinase domain